MKSDKEALEGEIDDLRNANLRSDQLQTPPVEMGLEGDLAGDKVDYAEFEEMRANCDELTSKCSQLRLEADAAKADLETSQCIPNHNKEENTIVPSTRMVIEKQTMPKILQEHEPFTPSQEEVESQERPDEVIIFLLTLHTRCHLP